MPMFRTTALLCLVASPVFAEKNAALNQIVERPGTVIFDDDFGRDELGKDYRVGKGEWNVKDGALVGRELKADEHAAVIGFGETFRDGLVKFSFKLNEAKAMHLSVNHEGGHLFRVIVTREGVILRADKDKSDPKSKPVVLGQMKKTFEAGTWHTIQLETNRRAVIVAFDNGVILKGHHRSFGVDKLGYRIVMRGENLEVDDIRVTTPFD